MSTQEDNAPLPSPPFFSIPNVSNLRDPALYPPLTTSSGARLRPHVLFRSADVARIDLQGWQSMHALGVAHVFDLRSATEVEKGWAGIVGKEEQVGGEHGVHGENQKEWEIRPGWLEAMQQAGVKRTWTPVFADSDYSPDRLAERYGKYMDEDATGFVQAYTDILGNGGAAYREVFLYLAGLTPAKEKEEEGEKMGALIHCTAGKDRTGVFFAILFDFLGVPREMIAEEYNLTERGLGHLREEFMARLMQNPAFKKYILAQMTGKRLLVNDIAESMRGGGGGGQGAEGEVQVPPEIIEKGRQAALRMIGATKESMLKSLEMIDEQFGGAENYMRERCGLGDEELRRLRENLVMA
ncbi:hypothetical protein EJ02DRAFT_33831 [Clathrospora elynae]|uniref:Tyrosine specific protein phosphatases domain-containing protein n=1 Tax=Clathrospora elynae TaxID=706981 RepID=A0A6A5T4A5_9PLEO|nr:hypothetical protein EJ02DRAFT_33831 [Clathrospora elynae]